MSDTKPGRRLHPALVGVVLLAIALIAAWPLLRDDEPIGDPAALPTPTPTAEASPTEPAAPTGGAMASPTATPRATATTPAPTPAPTATAAEDTTTLAEGAALDGEAVVRGEEGDVTDPAGEPPPDPEPAVDLREVALRGGDDALTIELRAAGPVPEGGPRSLVWSVDLLAGSQPRYTVTVQQLGARRFTGVLDWDTMEQPTLPEPPTFEGDRITVRVPRDLLAGLPVPFRWRALGQVDEAYEDHLPDGEPATFP